MLNIPGSVDSIGAFTPEEPFHSSWSAEVPGFWHVRSAGTRNYFSSWNSFSAYFRVKKELLPAL